MISHLKWMGHSATVIDIQKNLREDQQSCEVALVAQDYSVRAHKFVLSSCSDLLRSIIVELPQGQEATIIVPDIKGTLLDSVLAFIYTGETQISSSNLSDFLEAINILGIKSAISFECNTQSRHTQHTGLSPLKPIDSLQIVQEDIEPDNSSMQKIDTPNIIAPQEFLDVYRDTHPKLHYAINQISGNPNGEFILSGNVDEFTITQNPKLNNHRDTTKLVELDVENEVDVDENSIIEEYSSSAGDNIIEITTANKTAETEIQHKTLTALSTPQIAANVIEIKPKMRTVKMKSFERERLERQPTLLSSNESVNSKEPPYEIYQQSITIESPSTSSSLVKCDSYYEPLELAAQAVLNEGMSLQKAAQKYDVSKTVLWRRVRKDPNYCKTARENPVLSLACERLKHGESMKNISRELDIPMSTLHRHKVRLSLQGRLPKWVTFKKRDASSRDELREKLKKAVHACVHEGMSQNHAANLFDIPKSTLWRHLQKRMVEADAIGEEKIKQEVVLP